MPHANSQNNANCMVPKVPALFSNAYAYSITRYSQNYARIIYLALIQNAILYIYIYPNLTYIVNLTITG